MKVTVNAIGQVFTFETGQHVKGAEVLRIVCTTEGLHQPMFFGLNYINSDGEQVWIERSKKTLRELKNFINNINFGVKYYPEEVSEELVDPVSIEYFYKQVKNDIVSEQIYCPPDTAVLLGALTLQVSYGDYHDGLTKKIKLSTVLPKKVLLGQQMEDSEWIKNVVSFWKKYNNLDKDEGMMEYLKIIQGLDTYGVTYFNITNRKGTNVLLGITAYGLNIYEENNKLTPKIAFPWSEIKHLKFKDRKFTIQLVDKHANDFLFTTNSPKSSKNILNLGVGNHTLYVKRRQADPPELVKMKEKAKLRREKRLIEKQKLLAEVSAREELERKEQELLGRLQKMQADMDAKNRDLLEAQRRIEKLTAQLEDLQRSKELLEEQRNELNEMMRTLQESKDMEAMEKQKLEDEIRAKQIEVDKIYQEVQDKDEETRRLQAEVEEARRREEEARLRQEEEARIAEEERLQREAEEEERRRRGELEQLENANNTLPEININEDVQAQLKILQQQLDQTKKLEEETHEDKIHRENLRAGRDKFKTLRDIRSGNTKRRAELFENM